MGAANERKGGSAIHNKELGETVTHRRVERRVDQPRRETRGETESSNMMLDESFDFELREEDMESVVHYQIETAIMVPNIRGQ